MTALSPTQQTALKLYEQGFNVFPSPYEEDASIKIAWEHLIGSRMHKSQIVEAFKGLCNIAIMTGYTSNNLCVIHCSTVEAFKYQLASFQARDPNIWHVKYPTGGQVWFRIKGDCIVNMAEGEYAPDVTVFGHEKVVLAPPSILANGQTIQWQGNSGNLSPILRYGLGLKCLSDQPLYERRQETPQYILELYDTAAYEGWSSEELQQAIDDAKQHHQSKNAPIRHWEAAAAYIANHVDWSGKEGTSRLATVKALINILQNKTHPKHLFYVSLRQLADRARIKPDVAGKAIHYLQRTNPPILEFRGESTANRIGFYKFSDEVTTAGRKLIKKREENGTYSYILYKFPTTIPDDVLEPKCLGHNAALVMHLLEKTPLSKAQIVEQTRLPGSKVKSNLDKLKDLNIIVKAKGARYTMRANIDWQAIVQQTGVLGKGEKRRKKHQREREIYAGKQVIWSRENYDADNFDYP